MEIVQAPRASAILYSLLTSQTDRRPWLLPANICPIVPLVFMKAAVPFELVDISATTLHMDWEQASDRLKSRRFAGVLYAHTYGESSTPDELFALAKVRDPQLLVVDDRCLCPPDLDVPAAPVADVTLYSSGYAKHVDLGFGGYAFIKPDVRYAPVSLAFSPTEYERLEVSYKTSIEARARFSYHDCDWLQTNDVAPSWSDYRRKLSVGLELSGKQRALVGAVYAETLPVELQLPAPYQTWRFNLRVKNQRRILDAIFSAKLFASAHYASLAGIMGDGHCPQAERLAKDVVNLFIDRYFTPSQAEQVCAVILATLR